MTMCGGGDKGFLIPRTVSPRNNIASPFSKSKTAVSNFAHLIMIILIDESDRIDQCVGGLPTSTWPTQLRASGRNSRLPCECHVRKQIFPTAAPTSTWPTQLCV